eukprot:g1222.t1
MSCSEVPRVGLRKSIGLAIATPNLSDKSDDLGGDLKECASCPRLPEGEADGVSAQSLGVLFLVASELEAFSDTNWARHSGAVKLRNFATTKSEALRRKLTNFCKLRIDSGTQGGAEGGPDADGTALTNLPASHGSGDHARSGASGSHGLGRPPGCAGPYL